jgi:hypothetical protein
VVIDAILLAVRWRLARFRPGGADAFADGLLGALSAEMARRNRLYVGWDAQLCDREARRQIAVRRPVNPARSK